MNVVAVAPAQVTSVEIPVPPPATSLTKNEFAANAHVVWPAARFPCGLAVLAVTALSIGELSASKLVETPGGQTLAHEVFTQMHYGVTNHLAAMCLLLLATVAGVGVLASIGMSLSGFAQRWKKFT